MKHREKKPCSVCGKPGRWHGAKCGKCKEFADHKKPKGMLTLRVTRHRAMLVPTR